MCCAISRMASIDSFFAESMKAHVFTTSASASDGDCVARVRLLRQSNIASESTRFLGRLPSEIVQIFIVRTIAGLLAPGAGLWQRPGRKDDAETGVIRRIHRESP